jgi:hypothetical protein
MRVLTLVAVVVSALAVCSGSSAGSMADGSVSAYKSRVNQVCRGLTTRQLADIRRVGTAYQAHDQAGQVEALFTMIDHAYKGVKAMLAVPVPAGARAEMKPIRRNLSQMITFFDRLDPKASAGLIFGAAEKADAVGRRTDPLLDKAGLRDCGSRMTAKLDKAAAAYNPSAVA